MNKLVTTQEFAKLLGIGKYYLITRYKRGGIPLNPVIRKVLDKEVYLWDAEEVKKYTGKSISEIYDSPDVPSRIMIDFIKVWEAVSPDERLYISKIIDKWKKEVR